MNKFVIAALLGATSAKIDGLQLAEGLLEGAIDEQNFDQFKACIKDAEALEVQAEQVVKDLELKTIDGVAKALVEMSNILENVKGDISDCKATTKDLAKLEKEIAAFSNPKSAIIHIGEDILINGKNIIKEVNTAVADYNAGNSKDMGYQIGEAAAQVILGEDKENLAEIYQGFYDAFGIHIDIYALLICIQEVDKGLLMFDAVSQMIKEAISTKNYTELIPAAIFIFAAFKQMQQAMPACTAAFNPHDFSVIDKAIESLDAFKIMSEVPTLVRDFEELATDYENKNYEKFGADLGYLLQSFAGKKDLYLY
jgi:hypothetical protein